MLIKPFTHLTLAAIAGLFFTLGAEAGPGFTIKNTLKTDIDIYIFYGDEAYCGAHEKHRRIKAENTLSYGCSGHGENQCKIALFVDGKEICPSAHNACSKSMIVMKDRSRVIVRPGQKSGELICELG